MGVCEGGKKKESDHMILSDIPLHCRSSCISLVIVEVGLNVVHST